MTHDPRNHDSISRRRFLKTGTLAAAGGLIGCASLAPSSFAAAADPAVSPTPAGPDSVLRIAHLTDIHVKPSAGAPDGMRSALRHALARRPAPNLIINGGDAIMDALRASFDYTREQWSLWKRILAEECPATPVLNVIGNHDIWGWDKEKSGTTGSEPLWGKRWVLDVYERDTPWTSLDIGPWRIIALDSTQPPSGELGYVPILDEPQFDWLQNTIAAVPPERHILVVSHIPILSVCHFMFSLSDDRAAYERTLKVLMHHDARRLTALFEKHPNVRCCISGHIHLVDEVHYKGVVYYCNGAVCGKWWGGPWHNIPPGYAMLTLHPDGRVEREYIEWGWSEAT
ncbi:MAG: hypothetical protein Kow0059_12920 [Candidatus Sumerlaeia bacterium]